MGGQDAQRHDDLAAERLRGRPAGRGHRPGARHRRRGRAADTDRHAANRASARHLVGRRRPSAGRTPSLPPGVWMRPRPGGPGSRQAHRRQALGPPAPDSAAGRLAVRRRKQAWPTEDRADRRRPRRRRSPPAGAGERRAGNGADRALPAGRSDRDPASALPGAGERQLPRRHRLATLPPGAEPGARLRRRLRAQHRRQPNLRGAPSQHRQPLSRLRGLRRRNPARPIAPGEVRRGRYRSPSRPRWARGGRRTRLRGHPHPHEWSRRARGVGPANGRRRGLPGQTPGRSQPRGPGGVLA